MKKKLIYFLFLFNLLFAEEVIIQNEYVKLSPEESKFIKNTTINVITSNTWAPINMSNENGELSGIAVDFWNLIKKRADLKTNTTIVNKWNDVLDAIKTKKADITIGTSYDSNKKNYAIFSTPYISFPIAFATLFDKRFIPDESFLEGQRVAVGANYSSYVIMKKAFPKINFVQVKNSEEALKILSAGEVDAAVDILPVIAHLISKNGYSNLKIAGTSKDNIEFSFMARKDYTELIQIINRHVALLTPEDKNRIIKEWLTVKFDKRYIDKNLMINMGIILISLLFLYYFRQKSIKKYNNQLKYLSNTDTLTKLNNRRKIDSILNEEIKNKKFSLILLDIDHFKKINDDYGHLVGDEVLIRFAEILRKNINENDIIGRWGGEEFLIICKNTHIDKAEKLAIRLKTIIENEDFKLRKITASFGISEGKKELTLKNILANADKALYKAKENGRNQIVLYKN